MSDAKTPPQPETHPVLVRLRALLATLPEATEVPAWGHPTFRAGKKMFASFGARDGRATIGLKQSKAEQLLLIADPRFFVPAYVGQHGWVGIYADEVEWELVAHLFESAYRHQALARMKRALDASRR